MVQENGIQRRGLVAAASASMFVFGVVLLLMGSLLPSLQLSYAQAGNLGSFPLAGILVATVFIGPVLDKVGAKTVLAAGLAAIAVSLALIPSLHRYSELSGAAFAYGFGGGLLNTGANALVSDVSVPGRGVALNLLGMFFSLGAITAPLTLSTIGGGLSSAAVLRLLASLALLVLISVLTLHFPRPRQAGTRLATLLSVLEHPMVWLFGAMLFFESGSENCMFVWTSKIAALVTHTDPQRANLALACLSAAFGTGRLMAVPWLRWFGSRKTIWICCATVVVGALIAFASREFVPMTAGIIVLGLGLSAIFPTALGLVGDSFPGETGTVFGAIMTVALVGGTAGPALAARVAELGPTKVFWIPTGAAVAVATLTAFVTISRVDEGTQYSA